MRMSEVVLEVLMLSVQFACRLIDIVSAFRNRQ